MYQREEEEMKTFADKAYDLLRKVPKGRVTTYKEIAHALETRAYRGVGQAMRRNPYAPKVPGSLTPGCCHIRSDWGIPRKDIGNRYTEKNKNTQRRRDRVPRRKS
jgi:alkylated DNA nucleotide flippase Atl1